MAPSTAQPPAPAETPIEVPAGSEHTVRDPGWDVLVWNDPITLMSYVVLVLRRLFGYDFETATKLQVHHEGKAVVVTQPPEQAEVTVSRLHGFGLQATMGRG